MVSLGYCVTFASSCDTPSTTFNTAIAFCGLPSASNVTFPVTHSISVALSASLIASPLVSAARPIASAKILVAS